MPTRSNRNPNLLLHLYHFTLFYVPFLLYDDFGLIIIIIMKLLTSPICVCTSIFYVYLCNKRIRLVSLSNLLQETSPLDQTSSLLRLSNNCNLRCFCCIINAVALEFKKYSTVYIGFATGIIVKHEDIRHFLIVCFISNSKQ